MATPPVSGVNRSRTLLLVFGGGAASGLHFGLLHAFLWRNWAAPLTFVVASLAYSLVCYLLWRYVFPRVQARSLGMRLLLETVVSVAAFFVLSFGVVVLATAA